MDTSAPPRSIAVDALADRLGDGGALQLLDVRKPPAFERDPVLIAGARRVPPDSVEAWAATADRSKPVVVYCVHGHEVSQGAAAALSTHGFDASFLDGGLHAWQQQGRPTTGRAA